VDLVIGIELGGGGGGGGEDKEGMQHGRTLATALYVT
jgi:hypothetical protein